MPFELASHAEQVLTNARVVTADEVFVGTVVLRDGTIHAVERGLSHTPAAQDFAGDLLLPGLVELHTDNLEKHMLPRPGVLWEAFPATLMHDAQCAAAGITTVFDAVVIGDRDHGGLRTKMQHVSIEALSQARAEHLLRIDHYLHLRCEVATHDIVEVFERYADDPLLRLVSVMDHTPGQRQWRDLAKYRQYSERNGRFSDEHFTQMLAHLREDHEAYAAAHRRAVIAAASRRGVPLATHDDTEVEHVVQARDEGIGLSEFPTTAEAARAAREFGIGIIMGAPNLVRGGSHSGNVSAAELAALDLLDMLSSDYVPASLLQAAYLLHHRVGWTLPRAVSSVTRRPAEAVGLTDRGEVSIGCRADVVRVAVQHRPGSERPVPVVRQVWAAGQRVV
jgi:alpha-D-ribose 1-methylphosphonate 5-triphosphate diphosphatase